MCDYLTSLILSFFTVPSILRWFLKYTNNALAADPKAFEFEAPVDSSLAKFGVVWKEAIAKAEYFVVLKEKYKSTTVICANKECHAIPEEHHFIRVCSRCRTNVYCSYECQRMDWNAGRRYVCGANVSSSSSRGLSFRGNNYDTTFIKFIIRQTLEAHRTSI
ncbi:hypothetical protein GYMLUDRAFT_40482 [Collybiopsis luxurians FD-317 M1]|uniref:MYND-type domain-containing protein n=1 Tax=Collybiopsis luxurians FD-317 M1 TaxID=944289 RepID=A0A0D0CWH1_9AGAR|nr:hypothetical protein GYMLUDRAFT_40482 [Collybiopsis luxurians FD-317 M1]